METNSLLANLFRRKVANMDHDMKSEAKEDVGYPTGFLNFDYTNGYINKQKVDGKYEDYFTLGITDGSYVAVIGNTGTGKSTFVTQVAANIARQFKTTTIFEDNLEGGMTHARRRSLSMFSPEEYQERYIIRNSGINIENFYERIDDIYRAKTGEYKEKFLYDTGVNDIYGNPIMKLEPTIYIVDSIPLLMPKDFDDAENLPGRSSAAATAQQLTKVFKMIMQRLKAANIILFGINHIMENVQMTMFPTKSPVPGLKPNERIPAGRTVTYLANNIIRLDHIEKLKADKTYNIEGSVVGVSLVKSRSSGKKLVTRLVYDFDNGFDPWLSMLENLKNDKHLYGSGAYLALDHEKKFTFRFSNFREKMQEEEFRNEFMKVSLSYLKQIPNKPIMAKDLHADLLLSNKDIFKV